MRLKEISKEALSAAQIAIGNNFHIKRVINLKQEVGKSAFSNNGTLKWQSPVLCWSFFLLLLLVPWIGLHLCRKKHSQTRQSSQSLQALTTIIIPTSCAWPSDYSRLLAHSSYDSSRVIGIHLSELVCHVYDGLVEFRDLDVLPYLFLSQLHVQGWQIELELSASLWLRVSRWIAISHTPYLRTTHYDTALANYGQQVCDISTPERVSRTAYIRQLELDTIPYPHLKSCISDLLSSLEPGNFVTLQFTVLAPGISVLSKQFILSAIPFVPPKFTSNLPHRESTPLLLSLHHMIELFESASPTFSIQSITNVSSARALGLRTLQQRRETKREVRTAYIKEWGLQSWREQQFLLAWEAGLLKAGYLKRWQITVHAKK